MKKLLVILLVLFGLISMTYGSGNCKVIEGIDYGEELYFNDVKRFEDPNCIKNPVYKDWKEGKLKGKYDNILYFKCSPDGKNYAFVAKKGKRKILVKDGKEIAKYDAIGEFEYSPDGRSLSFVIKKMEKVF